MGICADIEKVIAYKSDDQLKKDPSLIGPIVVDDYFFSDEIKKQIKDNIGEIVVFKPLFYIGGGHDFKKDVLNDYDNNGGVFNMVDGLKYINDDRREELINGISKQWNVPLYLVETMLNRPDFIIDLGY